MNRVVILSMHGVHLGFFLYYKPFSQLHGLVILLMSLKILLQPKSSAAIFHFADENLDSSMSHQKMLLHHLSGEAVDEADGTLRLLSTENAEMLKNVLPQLVVIFAARK